MPMKTPENAARIARIAARANETFGNPDKARRWLDRQTALLDDRSPISAAETEEGARMVATILAMIDHGLAT